MYAPMHVCLCVVHDTVLCSDSVQQLQWLTHPIPIMVIIIMHAHVILYYSFDDKPNIVPHSKSLQTQESYKNMLIYCFSEFGRLCLSLCHLRIYRPIPMMVRQYAHIYMLKLMLLLRGKTKFQSLVPLKIQTIMYILYWSNHQIRWLITQSYLHSLKQW